MMGHLGLTPQSINKFGTYNVRAKEDAEVDSVAYYSLDGTRVTAPVRCLGLCTSAIIVNLENSTSYN